MNASSYRDPVMVNAKEDDDGNVLVPITSTFLDPITGAYHVQGDFLKPNTDYKIMVEITAIGSQIPDKPVRYLQSESYAGTSALISL